VTTTSTDEALHLARVGDALVDAHVDVTALRQIAWAAELAGLRAVLALGPGLLTDPRAGAVLVDALQPLAVDLADGQPQSPDLTHRVRRFFADLVMVVGALTHEDPA
jgi:hypothetical protein